MGWSLRIARIFGIDLKVHLTFLIIVLIGAWQGAARAENHAAGAAFGVVAVLLLFTCVVLHELGHSVVALRFGIPVREIILLPIGGVAQLAHGPRKAIHELLVAIAGPLVNVAILIVLVPILLLTSGMSISAVWHAIIRASVYVNPQHFGPVTLMLLILVQANLWLILFNMIPAFPLDGGRVLRALLWLKLPMQRATQIAASVGQALAIVLGLTGLMTGQFMLVIIAFFIFMGAGAEAAAAQSGAILATMRVGDAYNKYALNLTLDDRVSRVIEYVLTSYQPEFAVLNRGKFLGVVTREDAVKWVATNKYDVFVTEIMHDDVLHTDARITLDELREKLNEAGQRIAAVFDGEKYLGLVSTDDLAEAQMVLQFIRRGPLPPPLPRDPPTPVRPAEEPII